MLEKIFSFLPPLQCKHSRNLCCNTLFFQKILLSWVNFNILLLKKQAFMDMKLELSRAVKNLRISLQTNKLTGPSFTDADRRHETPGSGAKESVTPRTAGNISFIFVTVSPFPPNPREAREVGLAGCCNCSGFVSQLRTPSLETPIFYDELPANLPQGQILSLRYKTANESTLQFGGKHYLYLLRLFAVQTSLKR